MIQNVFDKKILSEINFNLMRSKESSDAMKGILQQNIKTSGSLT